MHYPRGTKTRVHSSVRGDKLGERGDKINRLADKEAMSSRQILGTVRFVSSKKAGRSCRTIMVL